MIFHLFIVDIVKEMPLYTMVKSDYSYVYPAATNCLSNCPNVIRLRTNALFKALTDCTRKAVAYYSSGTARFIVSCSKLRTVMCYKVKTTHIFCFQFFN